MTADDVVIVEADGSPSEGRRRPSSELPLHVARLRRPPGRRRDRPHPLAVRDGVLASRRREIPAVHYVLALLVAPGRDTLRVAPYATFGTAELARNVVDDARRRQRRA